MARSVIAPTYFYPEVTDGWAKVVMAAMYVSAVMVNPDSGLGAQKLQDFAAVAKQSHAAGIQVLGYIPSGYGTRHIADVVSEINSYRTWYEVDGFFIDEMYTADTSKVQYYQQIYDAVKESAINDSVSSEQLIFNPGQPSVPEEYMPLADTFLTFEGSAESYQSFLPADYTSNYAPSKFYHVVYRVSNATINATLSHFNSQHAEYLYITDLDEPNPYNALPANSTWAQLLAYMASTSPVAPASPSTITSKQVQEMHEQVAAQTAEVRKLYDWRDVMKTVHDEKLQELAAIHHTDRDSLLRVTSQREAALEGCKTELVASQQQVTSQGQQLEALNGRLTPQTAELHTAQSPVAQLQQQVTTAHASHTRHLSEAGQLRQELRQLSSCLHIAESDQRHLEATCKQVTATAEAEWAVKVAEAEKEGAVFKALAQGWQREAATFEPQLHHLQAQLAAHQKQASHSQDLILMHMQQELAELWQKQQDHTAQVRKVTAEAASKQASVNYLIKHLQSQLSSIQAANSESIQAVAKITPEETGWTIEQATASVARVLQVIAASQTE